SQWATAVSAVRWVAGPTGTSRASTSQYRQNFSHTIWTLAPMTRLGRSAGDPAAIRRRRQFHLSARPPSMQASLEPVVEQPVASSSPEAFQRPERMLTQRFSISAIWGYSSLSITFWALHSAVRGSAWRAIHVVPEVAGLRRALPS